MLTVFLVEDEFVVRENNVEILSEINPQHMDRSIMKRFLRAGDAKGVSIWRRNNLKLYCLFSLV